MSNGELLKGLLASKVPEIQPLMPIESVRREFLDWLSQVKFPLQPDAAGWEDCLRVFRPEPDDHRLITGRRIRFALCLYTAANRYLISILENLAPSARGVYTIAVHVSWKKEEWQQQRRVDTEYHHEFNDDPRARHVIWAEPFKSGGLSRALDAAAQAILGHELLGKPQPEIDGELVRHLNTVAFQYPEPDC